MGIGYNDKINQKGPAAIGETTLDETSGKPERIIRRFVNAMKTNKTLFLVAIAFTLAAGRSSADYMIGPFQDGLSMMTHIVDATVTEITKEHYARLAVQRHIKGANARTLLTSTMFSCTGAPPGAFGMEAGRRYIIMLRDAALFEETSYFEVTKRDDGTLGCRLSDFHKKWLGASDTWVTLDVMTRLMTPKQNK